MGWWFRRRLTISGSIAWTRRGRFRSPRSRRCRPAIGTPTSSSHGDHVVCVRERHHPDGQATNELVILPLDGTAPPRVLAGGHDFVASPRVSPDGARLAWLAWDHPNMPWDGTELWTARLTTTGVADTRLVAGGSDESIFQPEFSPDGRLHFIADRTGWWNLYRLEDDGTVTALWPREAEFGYPQWLFGFAPIPVPRRRQHRGGLERGRQPRVSQRSPLRRAATSNSIEATSRPRWRGRTDGCGSSLRVPPSRKP